MSKDWEKRISSLPLGLTVAQAARRLGQKYQAVRLAMIRRNYVAMDSRRASHRSPKLRAQQLFTPTKLEWRKPNVDLARKYGVSRERVRQLRARLGLPKVEARGRH